MNKARLPTYQSGNFSKAPDPPWFHRPKDFFMIITFSNVNTRLPCEDLNQKPSCILPLWQHHFHNPRTTSSHPSHTSWRHWRHHSPAFPTSGKLVLLSSGLDNWQLNFYPLRGEITLLLLAVWLGGRFGRFWRPSQRAGGRLCSSVAWRTAPSEIKTNWDRTHKPEVTMMPSLPVSFSGTSDPKTDRKKTMLGVVAIFTPKG